MKTLVKFPRKPAETLILALRALNEYANEQIQDNLPVKQLPPSEIAFRVVLIQHRLANALEPGYHSLNKFEFKKFVARLSLVMTSHCNGLESWVTRSPGRRTSDIPEFGLAYGYTINAPAPNDLFVRALEEFDPNNPNARKVCLQPPQKPVPKSRVVSRVKKNILAESIHAMKIASQSTAKPKLTPEQKLEKLLAHKFDLTAYLLTKMTVSELDVLEEVIDEIRIKREENAKLRSFLKHVLFS